MHYYKRNLGDYHKKAGRLTMLQHGAYNLLIDACYDREDFPTRDDAIDWAWASSAEEIDAVDFVLRKFFEPREDGKYVQKRIAEEIEEYVIFCEKQAEKGKKGGRPKKPAGYKKNPAGFKEKPNETQLKAADSQRVPQETLTTNHKPLTTNQSTCTEPFVSLPTNRHDTDGEEVSVSLDDLKEFQGLYPAVDVEQELRSMRGWLLTNKAKRKTWRGMAKFVNSWLAKEQNRGGSSAQNRPTGNPGAPGRKPTPAERVEIARQAAYQRELTGQSSPVGAVEAHGGNVRPLLGEPAR